MAHGEATVANSIFDRIVQVVEPQKVRHAGSLNADLVGDVLVGEIEIGRQPKQGLGAIDGIQILSLEILNKSPLSSCAIINIADDGRNDAKTCNGRSPPPTLTCDQFKLFALTADHHWLHEPRRRDGLRQGGQRVIVKDLSRLFGVGDDPGDREVLEPLAGGGWR
jgi:hypothetical protein